MKKILLTLFIFLFCISVGLNIKNFIKPFDYKTQSEMINISGQMTDTVDTEFETICDKIVETFKSDENFIKAFNADKEMFLKYRALQIDTVLPAFRVDPTSYGSNYTIYANSEFNEITKRKIQDYKHTIKKYCLYNDVFQSDGACSEESIESIFR